MKVMPWPARLVRLPEPPLPEAPPGTVWRGERSGRLAAAVERFGAGRLALTVDCGGASAGFPALGDDEGYRLETRAGAACIRAPAEWGVLRGLATLTQLCADSDALPNLRIEDAPRFPWRGLMVDVARHFIAPRRLEEILEAMALLRLNVLHLHLSDDQGFRFGSERFPRLGTIGGDGRYYSLATLRRLVAFAAARGIRVVPELDLPGHASSLLAAYPEWRPPGADEVTVSRRFGVHEACLDPTRAQVMTAIGVLFDELLTVFPDTFVHIGGDEVNPSWWRRHLGIADAGAAQARFNAELAVMLEARERRFLGWDEVVHPDAGAGLTVQSWRGAGSRERALAAGCDCVFSAGYYLDLNYGADIHYRFDPGAPAAALERVEAQMRADPRLAHVAAGLSWAAEHFTAGNETPIAPARGRVLGGEACMWGELVDDAHLHVRILSRLPAIAERLWSPAEVSDLDDMYRRLAATRAQLRGVGIDLDREHAAQLARAGLEENRREALAPLLAVLEPVKWYARLLGPAAMSARAGGDERATLGTRRYDATSPLDGIVDALWPESLDARALDRLLDTLEADGPSAEHLAVLETLAETWLEQARIARGLDDLPAPLPVAADRLGGLGEAVRAWLDGAPVDAAAVAAAQDAMDEVVLAVAPAVARLVIRG